jgi:hypothetical protein
MKGHPNNFLINSKENAKEGDAITSFSLSYQLKTTGTNLVNTDLA